MKNLLKTTVFLALLAPAVANAAGCDNANTQAEINTCTEAARAKADADLNRSYQQLLKGTPAENQASLKQAERTWITFRDQECAFEAAGSVGGSMHPADLAACKEAITTARTAQIKAFLANLH